MPIVSAGDLTLLRGQGHRSDVYTSFLVPPTLWRARINDATIVQGETTIAFDQGTGSFFSLVEALQDLWVGNSAGKDDVGGTGNGRLRIRSISSGDGGVTGTVTVGGHSLPLQDDQYLTFLHDYPLRPRWSYIDPATEIWYIDDDITYSDQHEEPPPVVIAGPHRAGFLASGSLAINVDVSDSYTIAQGATVASYGLSVASTAGTPTVNFNTGTGLGDITFSDPGYYWARYTVTDSNGKSQVSYRCYIVHDREVTGFYPYTSANITLTGDWATGGWLASFESKDEHSLAEIPAHTICIIWRESWYGTTKKNITFLPDSSSTIFAGYVRGEVEEMDMATGMENVDLIASTVEGRLARIYSFSASLVAQQSGVNHWGEIPNWHTVGTIAHALLRWRSTIFEITDVIGLRDNTWRRMGYEPDDNNLYEMVNHFTYNEGIRHRLVCDQGGRMHFAHDMQLMIASERAALSTAFELSKDPNTADYGGSLIIPRAPEPEVPFVESNGIYWDGTTWDDDNRPKATGDWCVIAPGGKPLHEGPSPKDYPKQTIPSLAYLRELAGRYLAQDNNPIEGIRVDFSGDYLGVLDIAYDDATYDISLDANDTPRGEILTNHPMYCRNVAARFRGSEGTWSVEAEFEPYAVGITGVETECPSFPPLGGFIPPVEIPTEVPGALMTGASVHARSANGNDWTKRVSQDVKALVEDPWWRIRQASVDPNDAIVWRSGLGYIKRTTDAFITTDVDVTPSSNPPNDAGDAPAPTVGAVLFKALDGSYGAQGTFIALGTWTSGGGDRRSWLCLTDDDGATWTWKSIGTGATSIGSWDSAVDVSTASEEPANQDYWWAEETDDKYTAVLSATRVVTVYEAFDGGTSKGYARVIDVGSTVHNASQFSTLNHDFGSASVVELSDSMFLVAFLDYDNVTDLAFELWLRIGEVDVGGNISWGTALQASSTYNECDDYSVCKLNDGSALLTVVENGATVADAMVVTASGVTGRDVTIKTETAFTTDKAVSVTCLSLDWNKVAIVWNELVSTTEREIKARIANISVTQTVIMATNTETLAEDNSDTPKYISGAPLGTSGFIVSFQRTDVGDTEGFVVAATVDGSDNITGGSEVQFHDDLWARHTIDSFGSNKAVVIYNDISVWGFYAKIITVSGTVPTLYSASYFTPDDDDRYPKVRVIDDDEIFVSYQTEVLGNVLIRYTVGNLSAGYSFDGLDINFGRATGQKAWMTGCDGTDLMLLEIAIPSLSISSELDLGSATYTQMDAQTYLAYPHVPFAYDDVVYVFGRMSNPFSLGTPVHIIRTDNGGGSFSLIEDSWDVDHCGSLIIGLDGRTYAIRNRSGQSKLYRDYGDSILLLRVTMPWGGQVAPRGMWVSKLTTDVYIAAWMADDQIVAQVPPPHLLVKDITFDHETTEPVEAIIQL